MEVCLTKFEDTFRPYFEAGIAYNLMLLENPRCIEVISDLEDQIDSLKQSLQCSVKAIVERAFQPNVSQSSVEEQLRVLLGEQYKPFYTCLIKVKSESPSWPWSLLTKEVRGSLHSKYLISNYFYLRKAYDKSKAKQKVEPPNLVVSLPPINDFLDSLLAVRHKMTQAMVVVTDFGRTRATYIYRNPSHISESHAFRIALAKVCKEDLLADVRNSPLSHKAFNQWDKVLVALDYIVSGESESNYFREKIYAIPDDYQQPYKNNSVLIRYSKQLIDYQKSLHSFYYPIFSTDNSLRKADHVSAATEVKTIMNNYVRLYVFMIAHASFFNELQALAQRATQHLGSKYEVFFFLNTVSERAHLKLFPDSWSRLSLRDEWKSLIKCETDTLQTLIGLGLPTRFWGYYCYDNMIPVPTLLLKHFAQLRGICKGDFRSLTHTDLTTFESKVNWNIAQMVFYLLGPMIETQRSVIIKGPHPIVLTDIHGIGLSVEQKLTYALDIVEHRFTPKMYDSLSELDLTEAETLLMGLSYHYQNTFGDQTSIGKYISTLDACYDNPVNDKKFRKGKAFADTLIKNFQNGNYSFAKAQC